MSQVKADLPRPLFLELLEPGAPNWRALPGVFVRVQDLFGGSDFEVPWVDSRHGLCGSGCGFFFLQRRFNKGSPG